MDQINLTIPTTPPLGATLTVPAGATAAALVHQGGGVHDRDGNMHAVDFASSLYKRLARGLAERGIATLRFDKRGSDKPAYFPHEYSVQQRVEDARAALLALHTHPATKALPLHLIGHSEGAMVLAKLAESEPVASVVSLCAPFGNVFELGKVRARRLVTSGNAGQKAKGERALEYYAKLEEYFSQGARMSPDEFVAFARPYMGAGYNGWDSFEWLAGHWANALDSDPPRYGRRMLAVQGGRDARMYDGNSRDWEGWCKSRPLAKYQSIEHLGHDLNDARQKVFRLDQQLVDTVAEWVNRASAGQGLPGK